MRTYLSLRITLHKTVGAELSPLCFTLGWGRCARGTPASQSAFSTGDVADGEAAALPLNIGWWLKGSVEDREVLASKIVQTGTAEAQ